MNCKKAKKLLSAYLDGEMNEHRRQDISNHLKICSDCNKEYGILFHQDTYLKQLGLIELSPNFRQNFWREVRGAEVNTVKNNIAEKILRWWIPAPVFCSFVIFIFLVFSVVSPLLYGQNIRTSEKIVQLVKKMCLPSTQQKIFSPLNFSDFCEEHCRIIREHCENKIGLCPANGEKL
ncbi:MAG: zf-HC2 domain-containing protein [Elusimicrobiota bacterium]|nr:zf-HC2 domain-containing protein [Elusimicrobiota bacterium]